MMHIDEPEKLRSEYRQAADKRDWIIKNADCFNGTPYELAQWLLNQGEEVEHMGRLPGNPAFVRPHKCKTKDAPVPETRQDSAITLTAAEAGIIREYVHKYHEAYTDKGECDIMAAGDRLATVLDVILRVAAARAGV